MENTTLIWEVFLGYFLSCGRWLSALYTQILRLLRNAVNRPSNQNPSKPSLFASVKLVWTLAAFLYCVFSFHLKKPVSDVFSLKVVLWNTKVLSGSERENITFSLLISTAEEFCTRETVWIALRHTSLFLLYLGFSIYHNKKCRACQCAHSFVSICALHSTTEKMSHSLDLNTKQLSLCRKQQSCLIISLYTDTTGKEAKFSSCVLTFAEWGSLVMPTKVMLFLWDSSLCIWEDVRAMRAEYYILFGNLWAGFLYVCDF